MSSKLHLAVGSSSQKRLKVLVVDDQLSQLKLMALLLQHTFPGCQSFETQSPAEAIEIAQREEVDCVIADYQMPELNGVEMATQIREYNPHLPIILCTGGGDEMLVAEAMTSGITQYLPKTRLNPDSLHRTVCHAIQITAHERLIADQQQELEHFSHALAHDFKQPIRQIKTFSQIIRSELGQEASEDIQKHADFLISAADRLARLVDVMSEYALQRKTPELVDVDVEDVSVDVSRALDAYVRERGGRLLLQARGVAKGDKALLFQVLQNLIVNGLKYNTSAVPTVRVSSSFQADKLIISVKDNGIGIPDKFHKKIFQPMTRLHAASAYEGTGLGLALALKAATAQRGVIACASAPGEGSQFSVVLLAAGRDLEAHTQA